METDTLHDESGRDFHPLGLSQLPVWLDMRIGGSDGYHLGCQVRIEGRINHDDLRQSLRLLMARHDALRLRVDPDQPRQWFANGGEPPLRIIAGGHGDPEAVARAHVEATFSVPMPLGDNPLFRVDLLEMATCSYLILCFNHIIADSTAVRMAMSLWFNAYQAVTSNGQIALAPGSSVVASLDADAAYAASDEYDRDLAYWVDRFDPPPRPLLERAPARTGLEGLALTARRSISADFDVAAKRAGTVPQRALFALFCLVLGRRYGQKDVVCGMALHNRDRSNLNVIGMLAGLVPVLTRFEPWWTLAECAQAFSEQVDEDLRRRRSPIDAIKRALGPAGANLQRLFDVTMSWMTTRGTPNAGLRDQGITLDIIDAREASPIALHAHEHADGGIDFLIRVNPDFASILDPETLADLLEAATACFILDDSSLFETLDRISIEEAARIDAFSGSALTAETVVRPPLLPARVSAGPAEAVAVVDLTGETAVRLRYGELDAAATRLATRLAASGVGAGSVVGLCLARDLDHLVALLAIWRTGAAALPLDASYPEARLGFMLADAGARLVLAEGPAAARFTGVDVLGMAAAWAEDPGEAPRGSAGVLAGAVPEGLAYVIYTSGSTGRPKGVMVDHAALAAFAAAIGTDLGISGPRSVLSAAAPVFDAYFMDLSVAFGQGGCLTRLRPTALAEPAALAAIVAAEGIDYIDLTPSVWRTALSGGWRPGPGMRVVTGGEALDPDLAAALTSGGARLYNSYGPTEATVVALGTALPPGGVLGDGAVPIGRPLAGMRAYVLDARLEPVPVGTPGELWLSGAQLARGYLNRPGLTAAAFMADPFSATAGARMYRTGDLARWRTDGQLEFLGRIDAQVKIRGMRVELGEIESALTALPGVTQAAVVSREEGLVAFLVPEGAPGGDDAVEVTALEGLLDLSALRGALRTRLPEHMVPRSWVGLTRMPLTSSGKIDRRALPTAAAETARRAYAPPRTPTEHLVAETMGALLGLDRVGRSDDFFSLGGHSLTAVRLATQLRDRLGAPVPIRLIFEHPEVASLAEAIGGLDPTLEKNPLRPIDRATPVRLSFQQERLWFLDRLDPAASSAYRLDGAIEMRGRLDTAALGAALATVVDRHESLRTVVAAQPGTATIQTGSRPDAAAEIILPTGSEDPVLSIAPDAVAAGFSLCVENGRHLDEAGLAERIAAILDRPYDIERGPLFRAHLIACGPERNILVIGGHHIILDGWSVTLLLREVGELYAAATSGRSPRLAELPVQYADYAAWQRKSLDEEQLTADLAWWRETLAGAPMAIALPTDRPRQAASDYRGDWLPIAIPRAVTARLTSLAQTQGATLFMALQAAFSTFLSRLGAGDDVVVGTVVAGRPRAELEGLVGFFVNTLALRHSIDGRRSFREQIRAARTVTLAAFERETTPFDAVIRAINPPRSMSHAPLTQVMLALHNMPGADQALGLPGITVAGFGGGTGRRPVGAQFDLALELTETEGGLSGEISFATQLFDRTTVERLVGMFVRFLAAATDRPDEAVADLPLLETRERLALIAQGAGPRVSTSKPPLLPARVSAGPAEAVAVVDLTGETAVRLRYGELDAAATRLATRLAASGVGAGSVVGLCLARDLDHLVALLAIWRTGAAALPLDASYPEARLGFMLADAGARLVLAEGPAAARFTGVDVLGMAAAWAEDPGEAPRGSAGVLAGAVPEGLAYVIYTSGSTGRPKGVMVDHAALAAFAAAIGTDLGISGPRSVLSAAAPVFDAYFMDLSVAFGQGGCLTRLRPTALAEPAALAAIVAAEGIDYIDLTPSVWRTALSGGWRPGPGMRVVTGGEALDPDLAAALTSGGARLYNSYGPTEATVVALGTALPPGGVLGDGAVPIGRPLAGMRAYVLDARLEPVPVGTPGELWLSGAQLARGYLNRPGLTAAAFMADPFSATAGARMYRTGDLARWRTDGQLEFLGRIDAQVKIRGMRVELGEIESALTALPGVTQAAVVSREEGLVAFLVPEGAPGGDDAVEVTALEGLLDLSALRGALRTRLPEHMVPRSWVGLTRMPLTSSGKIDRRALPTAAAETARRAYAPPRTPTEHLVAETMGALLGLDRVGRSDDFFSLGGHSLTAVRLATQLRDRLGAPVPIRLIFEHPEVASLAEAIGGPGGDQTPAAADLDLAGADIGLADALPPPATNLPAGDDAEGWVLLTGATGFLGRYLLRELLCRTRTRILCLVRGADAATARAKLIDGLRRIPSDGLPEGFESRVDVVLGDLSVPGLGLETGVLDQMAERVGLILHNAAQLNMVMPYGHLRTPNTLSLFPLLELMSRGRAKTLRFVSTMSVFDGREGEPAESTTPLQDHPPLASGYAMSKWTAEIILERARRKGYDARVLRPGLIIGDATVGYYGTEDTGVSFMRLFLELNAIPDDIGLFPLPWMNVDRVARRVIDIATLSGDGPAITHVFEHSSLPSDALAAAFRAGGLAPEILSRRDWAVRAVELLARNPGHPSGWLTPILTGFAEAADPVEPPDAGRRAPVAAEVLFPVPAPPSGRLEVTEQEPVTGLCAPVIWIAQRTAISARGERDIVQTRRNGVSNG